MTWLHFALMTVFSWGIYGILLGMGRIGLTASALGLKDAPNAGLKAFLVVGIAYFVVAIVGPVYMLMNRVPATNWSFTFGGIFWSFLGGAAGAVGAFTLILALGAGHAKYGAAVALTVMPIVFGGAPIVNSVVSMLKDPPAGGFKAIPLPFVLGVALVATGGFLVAKFVPAPAKPPGAAHPKPAAVAEAAK